MKNVKIKIEKINQIKNISKQKFELQRAETREMRSERYVI